MYTYFDKTRQVLCVMQVIDDNDASARDIHSVMLHRDSEEIEESDDDSTGTHRGETAVTPPDPGTEDTE